MKKVVLDEQLRSRLPDLSDEVAVVDEAGRTVGYFIPAERHEASLYAWARAEVSDEELDLARREPGGKPLAEILARLGEA